MSDDNKAAEESAAITIRVRDQVRCGFCKYSESTTRFGVILRNTVQDIRLLYSYLDILNVTNVILNFRSFLYSSSHRLIQ